jgi:hypothetical protein
MCVAVRHSVPDVSSLLFERAVGAAHIGGVSTARCCSLPILPGDPSRRRHSVPFVSGELHKVLRVEPAVLPGGRTERVVMDCVMLAVEVPRGPERPPIPGHSSCECRTHSQRHRQNHQRCGQRQSVLLLMELSPVRYTHVVRAVLAASPCLGGAGRKPSEHVPGHVAGLKLRFALARSCCRLVCRSRPGGYRSRAGGVGHSVSKGDLSFARRCVSSSVRSVMPRPCVVGQSSISARADSIHRSMVLNISI